MAAEKLTRARLVQIIIIFSILLTAFTWRTMTHQPKKNTQNTCVLDSQCVLKHGEQMLTIYVIENESGELTITTQGIDNKRKIKITSISIRTENNKFQATQTDPNSWQVKRDELPQLSDWTITTQASGQLEFQLDLNAKQVN